jgi:hypothetical protein
MKFFQAATYWASNGNLNPFGEIQFLAPVEIMVRWEDSQSLFVDNFGNEQVSKSVVWTKTEISPNSFLMLGVLQATATNPRLVENAHEVRATGSTPNLKVSKTEYKCWL